AGPTDAVAFGQLDLAIDFPDRLLDGAAQVAATHAVLDRHIARVLLAIDLACAVAHADVSELGQGHALSGGCQQPYVRDGLLGIPVRGGVARHQVIALLALQYLGHRVSAHRCLHCILHVADVDSVPRRLIAVDYEVQVRLPDHAEKAQVPNPWNTA